MSRLLSLIFITFFIGASVVYGQKAQPIDSEEIIEVGFCELVSHPETYNDKTVRVRASWYETFEGDVLYDIQCDERGALIEPDFDCTSGFLCNSLGTYLESFLDRDEEGDVIMAGRRAEFTLTGRFLAKTGRDKRMHFALLITMMDQGSQIPHGTPLPGKKEEEANRNFQLQLFFLE